MSTRNGQDIALVLAAHGDRAGEARNNDLFHHRDALAASGEFRAVVAGVLKGQPSLETALERAARTGAAEIAVFPFFMADGYFAGTVLRERIAASGQGARSRLLRPLGLDPGLPALLLDRARTAAGEAGFVAAATELLVVGHGSKFGPDSAESTERMARALADFDIFGAVTIALLEEDPRLEAVLAAARPPVVVLGFFSGDGLHAGEDVPRAIRDSGVRAVYAGTAGQLPAIADLVRNAVLSR